MKWNREHIAAIVVLVVIVVSLLAYVTGVELLKATWR